MTARDIYADYEAALAKDPAAALERALERISSVPAEQRIAPPFWINKLVDGRLPVEALRLVEGLRMFDLILDEARQVPVEREVSGPRFEQLRAWAEALPDAADIGVTALDWSRAAWERGCSEGGSWIHSDFYELSAEIMLAVLRSPLCARLQSLDLSKGSWTAETLSSHDDYLDAEQISWCYPPSDLHWGELLTLPCAKTLERLYLGECDLNAYDLGYDEDDDDFRWTEDDAPFPKLLHLDLARGKELSHGGFLRGLLARGAFPRLETLDLTDDLHERLQSYLDEEDEDYDDDDRMWVEHDYGGTLDGEDGYDLAQLCAGPASLERVALGGFLDAARERIAAEIDDDDDMQLRCELVSMLDIPRGTLAW